MPIVSVIIYLISQGRVKFSSTKPYLCRSHMRLDELGRLYLARVCQAISILYIVVINCNPSTLLLA